MTLSIDESIQKFKAEILSQDWAMSRKRIEQLEPAFVCLRQRFKTRKNIFAILTMGDNILQYLKKKGRVHPPEFIDFLKETMAHVVNIYEDNRFDPESEEKIFKRMYGNFALLRKKIEPASNAGAPAAPPANRRPDSDMPPAAAAPASTPSEQPRPAPQTGNAGSSSRAGQAAPTGKVSRTVIAPPRNTGKTQPEWVPAEGIAIRLIGIGAMHLGVPEENIALLRPLSAKARKKYLKTSQIPLRDFRRFFQKLSSQFKGEMATIKDSFLKELVLPLVTPRSVGLPNMPDENGDHLIVLTTGQRHGIIFCTELSGGGRTLRRFRKGRNGDLAGLAYLDDEKTVPLLNPFTILEREGFLTVPA